MRVGAVRDVVQHLAAVLARGPRAAGSRRRAPWRKCLLLSRKPSLINEIAFLGGGAVNKSGLIDAVSKTTSLPKRDAENVVNALVHVVSSEVRAGRRVVVSGFGSFNPTHRGARMGRNPRTGEAVRIASSRGVRFAASGSLKDVLNGKATLSAPKSAAKKKGSAKGAGKGTVRAAAKSTARKTSKKTVRAGTGPAKRVSKKSTTRAGVRSPRGGSRKVVGRASTRRTTRAPARKAARISARQAAGRPPAGKAMKRSAKKAVRRA